MKKKQLVKLILFSALAAAVITGCGDKKSTASSTEQTTNAAHTQNNGKGEETIPAIENALGSGSETAPAETVPAPETVPTEIVPAPGTAPAETVPAPETAPAETVPAPGTAPAETVPAPETVPAEIVPAPGTASAETVPAPGTVPAETVPAPGTVPAETVPAPGTAPAETVPAPGTAPAETVPAPVETAPVAETPAELGSWNGNVFTNPWSHLQITVASDVLIYSRNDFSAAVTMKPNQTWDVVTLLNDQDSMVCLYYEKPEVPEIGLDEFLTQKFNELEAPEGRSYTINGWSDVTIGGETYRKMETSTLSYKYVDFYARKSGDSIIVLYTRYMPGKAEEVRLLINAIQRA